MISRNNMRDYKVRHVEKADTDPYRRLAAAIVLKQCNDYVDAVRKLEKKPNHQDSIKIKRQALAFFKSEWYMMLTDIDPDKLIEALNEKARRKKKGYVKKCDKV